MSYDVWIARIAMTDRCSGAGIAHQPHVVAGLTLVAGLKARATESGVIVARCVWCRIGFVVREETAERARYAMGVHLQYAHGETPSRAVG